MLSPAQQSNKDFWIQKLGAETLPEDAQWGKWLAHGVAAVTYAIEHVAERHRFAELAPLSCWKIVSSVSKRHALENGYVRPLRTTTFIDKGDAPQAQPTFDTPTEWLQTDEQGAEQQ
jgi:hypothetical protein